MLKQVEIFFSKQGIYKSRLRYTGGRAMFLYQPEVWPLNYLWGSQYTDFTHLNTVLMQIVRCPYCKGEVELASMHRLHHLVLTRGMLTAFSSFYCQRHEQFWECNVGPPLKEIKEKNTNRTVLYVTQIADK